MPLPSRKTLARQVRVWAGLLALVSHRPALVAQVADVRLEVALDSTSHDPVVFTRNLLEDTPWLNTLREGLPIRLQYRLELWRSRQAWLDDVLRQLEWTIVVRHEPLLDQFTVTRIAPNGISYFRYATPGALAAFLSVGYRFPIAPRDDGRYYYTASLAVSTLSDSDLDKLDRVLKGEIDPQTGGGSLADRARRLILRLAGLPTLSLSATSQPFEVKR